MFQRPLWAIAIIVIYIPLCLYFNEKEENLDQTGNAIYIPLCLYFNPDVGDNTYHRAEFTFHYVSILINSVGWWGFFNLIYIPLCLDFNCC